MAHIELDICYGNHNETLAAALSQLTDGTGATATITKDPTPSDWPTVTFTGTRDQLTEVLTRYDPGTHREMARLIRD